MRQGNSEVSVCTMSQGDNCNSLGDIAAKSDSLPPFSLSNTTIHDDHSIIIGIWPDARQVFVPNFEQMDKTFGVILRKPDL